MKLEQIGKYEILAEIGRGTMGTVYKAKDPTLNRVVAIKTMAATPGRNDESKQRFQREAQAAAHLSHPNIVTVHDLGEEKGFIYMAMEYLEGKDLRDVIDAQSLTTLDEHLHVMEQVAAGLAFAHSKGVVHRDLKPANIQVQPNGQVKIVDFGLARLGGSDMTQDGIVLGTPNYMSPEQALGDRVDARTDIFSAGGVFYEMLAGRKPFDAETTPAVLYQVVHKDPVPLRKWAPDLPPIVVEVVDRCLAKDKNLRFQNGRQLRAALGVVRQAYEAGRLETATLAEESQRAHEDARKNDSQRLGSPSSSRPPWMEGNVALDPTPLPVSPPPRSASSPRSMTLSGRAATEPPGRRRATQNISPVDRATRVALLLLLVAGAAYLYSWLARTPGAEVPPGTEPGASDSTRAQVGALTEALVESQTELATKHLEDKNWAGAIAQAEDVLKLQPTSARARQILDEARGRRKELDAAATEARRSFEAGNLEDASRALDRVLELDPKHPVVGDLTARLNSTFASRAEEARRLTQRARREAERAHAQGGSEFTQAVALSAEGEVLFRKSEYADATQRYLEARDAFDRSRRTVTAAARPPQRSAGDPPTDQRGGSLPPVSGSGPGVVVRSPPAEGPSAPGKARQFVTGKSVVATGKAGGSLTGFDTADVKTQKVPDLVGHLEFEVDPNDLRSGDSFGVRLYLVNEGKKPVRVRNVSFTWAVDGKRTTLHGALREREVAPQERELVAETRGVWREAVTSWGLEAAVVSDRDETCTSRLTWE
jgi:serine/threonine protein kinase